jgi:hypothetical protein
LLKDNSVRLIYRGDTIQLEKHGLYRLDTADGEFRVYDGEALIQTASGQQRVKAGNEASLNGVLALQHFNPKLDMDDFYHWSSQRAANLAYASVTASQSVLNTGTPWYTGGWMWSSLLDEWTFLPGAGILYSPFGWGFWSPLYMGYYYTPVYPVSYGGASVGAPASALTGRTGTTVPIRNTGGNSGKTGVPRPLPALAVAGVPRSGTSYGGVAAAMPRSASAYRSFSRGGGGFGSANPSSSSGNSGSGAHTAGGGFGGGFSGGHGGGGGHR